MTHEQKPESAEFRTREDQIASECWNWGAVDLWKEISQPELERHLTEAEARGAAEQRRKDEEGAEPVAWAYEALGLGEYSGAGGYGPDEWRETTSKSHPSDASGGFSSEHRNVRPLYTRPANVAALQARVKELEERLHYLTGIGSDNSSSGPRIIDLCFTAFMRRAAGKNEDGGSCDWFNDTRPHIAKQIEHIRAAAIREGG